MRSISALCVLASLFCAGVASADPGAEPAPNPEPVPLSAPSFDDPKFRAYMQGLERNDFHLSPETADRVAHQACIGGPPGFIGWELTAQGVYGPGSQERLFAVARQYMCPVQ